MESRIRLLFLNAVLAIGMALPALAFAADETADADDADAAASQVIKPELNRREIDIEKIDSEDFEAGGFVGLMSVEDFGVNMVIGARLAYHVTEDFFVEFAYGQTDTSETSYELLSGGAELLTPEERKLTYYNVSVGYNLLPGEVFIGTDWAFTTAMYVIGGIGNTTFGGDDRFTFNLGGGLRFLTSDWFAVHIDVRDHIYQIDLLGEEKTAHNLEAHGGFTIFF